MCPGCYNTNTGGYCLGCRKLLFDGAKVSSVLNFDSPKAENLSTYQEKTKRLSISGVQLKYSLLLDRNELKLTEKGGQYILKPIPPTTQIANVDQAPENEHLTMQIASQIFGIQTALNALMYFKDGTPAYITRRFDLNKDGSKHLQEDMAQIGGHTRQSLGENFKYHGTYEDIGILIRNHAAAYIPALENYFRIVLFNYIFSNGDAHLKNFSLIRTLMGDYTLSPTYDLMCTVLHTPHEQDTALSLYEGDLDSSYYSAYGCYGQSNFRELANRLGLIPNRANRIISQLLTSRRRVEGMIENSLLKEDIKKKYLANYKDKLRRMGLTAEIMGRILNTNSDDPYGITKESTKLIFRDNSIKVGYFQERLSPEPPENENKFTFVENHNKVDFVRTNDDKYVTIINADELENMEYEGVGIQNL